MTQISGQFHSPNRGNDVIPTYYHRPFLCNTYRYIVMVFIKIVCLKIGPFPLFNS